MDFWLNLWNFESILAVYFYKINDLTCGSGKFQLKIYIFEVFPNFFLAVKLAL
jgi:hypothetical protein